MARKAEVEGVVAVAVGTGGHGTGGTAAAADDDDDDGGGGVPMTGVHRSTEGTGCTQGAVDSIQELI
jgi:hypothetical protein